MAVSPVTQTDFTVHLFAVVRIPVAIKAGDKKEAVENAIKETDVTTEIHRGEYAEEIICALVDVKGDIDYAQSTWHSADGGDYRDPIDLQKLADRIATLDPTNPTDLEQIIQQARALSNAHPAGTSPSAELHQD